MSSNASNAKIGRWYLVGGLSRIVVVGVLKIDPKVLDSNLLLANVSLKPLWLYTSSAHHIHLLQQSKFKSRLSLYLWPVVVSQLAERSDPALNDTGSSPAISNFLKEHLFAVNS